MEGVARVECRTTVDEFNGSDRLLRLRWPTPGAGCDAGQRSGRCGGRPRFRIDPRTRFDAVGVDTAKHPWTLENPAYGWFGLSTAARIRVGDNDAHAISVAEVVTPAEAESAPLARDLMVALVRAGVTATCSGADKPRYGHLEVDSNLPDTRISLGGPERNAFTAAVLSGLIRPTPQSCAGNSKHGNCKDFRSGIERRWRPNGCPMPTCAVPARSRFSWWLAPTTMRCVAP